MDSLPNELILHIATWCEFTSDIYALSLVNHRLQALLTDYVYEHDCRYENGRGLERAVQLNCESAVRRSLHHGAGSKLTAEHLIHIISDVAIQHASLKIVLMLLEPRINMEHPLLQCPQDHRGHSAALPESLNFRHKKLDSIILDQAVRFDRVDVVRMLVEAGLESVSYGDAVLARAGGWAGCEMLEVLVEAGCDVNQHDAVFGTALHHATDRGKTDNIRYLIDKGADLETRNGSQGTPLCIAAMQGMMETVQVLVEAGACLDPPLGDGDTLTPLLWAAQGNHHDIAQYILERIDLRSIIQGDVGGRLTLLTVAAILGYKELAEQVLASGHDVNQPARDLRLFQSRPRSVLSWAAEYGQVDVVALLLRHGANVKMGCDDRHLHPLAIAAQAGHSRIVEILLEAGAPIHGPATTIPEQCSDLLVIQLLLDYGVRPTKRLVLSALSNGNIELLQGLLDRGFRLKDCGQVHDLFSAVLTGGPAAMDLLADHNIIPDVRDLEDWIPFGNAVVAGNAKVVRYFLSKGFGRNPLLRHRGLTMLCNAVYGLGGEDLVHILDVLISEGGSGEALTEALSEALTEALHAAISLQREIAIPLLLNRGASTRARSREGKTALEVACETGNIYILHCLLERLYTEIRDLGDFRRCIMPFEQQARAADNFLVTKAISHFYYRRRYPVP
ncbi:ankyrin repeat-containing domain protein [Aspergillus granulosus]|uniref:Ankyrin repeat-containing domain protein n=1 Tax=Aspergillus granulosus TaxID=176169 RepID=A0ABR4H816_9EURO